MTTNWATHKLKMGLPALMGLPFWQPADCWVQFDTDFVMKCWLVIKNICLATVYRSQQLYTAEQWLSCKKEVGNAIPSFFFFLFLLPLSLPCREVAHWKPTTGSGELCSSPSPHTHFGVFWAWKTHLAATSFYKCPKKIIVLSARSAGMTFKNLHQQRFPGV